MNRMKRWLLLLAAVVVILPNAQALKATSLIFGRNSATSNKTTTTTTTTTELPVADDNEEVPSDQLEEEEVTKPPLTGIPQIDYVWDPNLPRELNGFNLSSYPFLNSVPDAEDIDFKCDGLHDGFYASIKFGCQLYHHCIYGIRHDFLCANFTAFDQKTFICHFVSEVNCKNSAKYWFRNDALYRATTTTTTTTTTIAPPPTTTTERQRRPGGRKPMRRRRPQNDYYYEDEEYDDYVVEERVNRRRKPAVRNRHRPVYEDDYPENDRGYEDEEPLDDDYDYEQRTQSRNRNRPANNRRFRNRERNNRRNMNEQRSSSRSQDDEPKSVADVVQPEPTRRYNRDRRPVQDEREKVRERDRNRYVTNNNKRPLRNDDEEDVDIEYERPRSNYDEPEEELPPRRNNFRNSPTEKRVKGRTSPAANRDDFEDPPSPPPRRKNVRDEIREEEPPKVRPSGNGASVFNRPRVAPKISRPVPLTEKQKYDYKKTESAPVTPSEKDEYYDEYEDELPPQKTPSKTEVRPQAQHKTKTVVAPPSRNSRPSVKDETPKEDYVEEEYEDEIVESEPIVKPVAKSESRPIKATGPDQDVTAPMRRNTNDNSDRSSVPSGPSQTEQQQKNRDKFRNSFRSQSRQPIDDTPKETVPVSSDDRGRNNQKPTSESSRPKTRSNFRYNVKDRPSIIQAPTATDEDFDDAPKEIPQKSPIYVPYKPSTSRLPPTAKDVSPQLNVQPPLIDETSKREKTYKNQQFPASGADSLNDDIDVRPAVRVVKRPFLPSRGGSPYLPRGLRPVGSSEEETYSVASSKERDDSPAEEHIPPQPTRNVNHDQRQHFPGPLTTQPPQVDPPKDPLEHIYSEYDVTLNDALNPTLKPLVTSRGSPIGFSLNSKYDQQYSYVPLNTATAQSRSSVVQVPYDDRKFKTYVDEYEY